MIRSLIFALLLLAACVTTSQESPQLLPEGVYHHDVSLEMEGKDPQKFAGLLKISGDRMTMVMLSPFGTTLARITDHLRDEEENLVVYAEEIKPYEDRMTTIYRALKPAFIDPNTKEIRVYGRTLTIDHQGQAGPGIPRTTVIAGEGIRLAVEVTGFETARR